MAAYTYRGTEPRYYPGLGIEAVPGLSADLDEDPGDGRWQPTRPKGVAKPATKDGE
ncbi:hypothetical protein [Streptomyces sp. CB01201]|uniref:hypothetical protein n=1 Tax=Streptomyces sp. CB01201 TaxID=2020324 RepID=UPI00131C5A66|nr:hypothetical protein [Streptomyces sp. CB01201]